MTKNIFQDIKQIISNYQKSLAQHLPALEQEIEQLIQIKCSDKNRIDNTLDTLLSLTEMGLGKDLFIRLIEYYKTVDLEGAAFYWNEFDKDEE